MKRKRFVKMVMSRGFQRNEAELLAKMVSAHDSYEALYEWLPSGPGYENLKKAMQNICDGVLALIRPVIEWAMEIFGCVDWQQILNVEDEDASNPTEENVQEEE